MVFFKGTKAWVHSILIPYRFRIDRLDQGEVPKEEAIAALAAAGADDTDEKAELAYCLPKLATPLKEQEGCGNLV